VHGFRPENSIVDEKPAYRTVDPRVVPPPVLARVASSQNFATKPYDVSEAPPPHEEIRCPRVSSVREQKRNYLFAALVSGSSTDSNAASTKLASPFNGMK
jgi:hypothetical protein